jgi:hypothetical protein
LAGRGLSVRAIRVTVQSEAVLQVPTLRPHRNPVQGNNRMWLLRARTREQGMSVQARPERTQEMRCLPGRARSVELPVPYQEGGEGKSKSCIRRTAIPPPSRGDTKKQHPIRGTGCRRPTQQTRASSPTPTQPAQTQPAPITRNRSQPGRGQKRTNAGTTVDPADQQNPSTQANGSQRPQRHLIPTRRVMEATGNSTQQTQSGNSQHMEIDSDNEA